MGGVDPRWVVEGERSYRHMKSFGRWRRQGGRGGCENLQLLLLLMVGLLLVGGQQNCGGIFFFFLNRLGRDLGCRVRVPSGPD